jgi:hypothetical protein
MYCYVYCFWHSIVTTHVLAGEALWCKADEADHVRELGGNVLQQLCDVSGSLLEVDIIAGDSSCQLEGDLHGDSVGGDGGQVVLVPLELIDVVDEALLVGLCLEAGQRVHMLVVVLGVELALGAASVAAALIGVLAVLVVVLVVP